MQKTWDEYVQQVYELCDPEFWHIYDAVRKQYNTTVEKVLKRVLSLVTKKQCRSSKSRKWPTSNPILNRLVQKKCGDFTDFILRTTTIDLSHFRLPGVTKIQFMYVDPIYVWIQQCNEMHDNNHKLVWRPQVMKHPVTGETVYGAGVQFGLLLQTATENIPADGHIALINLSWDGGESHHKNRSASPICVQVSITGPPVALWTHM